VGPKTGLGAGVKTKSLSPAGNRAQDASTFQLLYRIKKLQTLIIYRTFIYLDSRQIGNVEDTDNVEIAKSNNQKCGHCT
jgi:hypothetical protein